MRVLDDHQRRTLGRYGVDNGQHGRDGLAPRFLGAELEGGVA